MSNTEIFIILAKLSTKPTILKELHHTSCNWRIRYKHASKRILPAKKKLYFLLHINRKESK